MNSALKTFVVSAPSGTGKTTLNRKLLSEHPDLIEMSVSYTARKPRPRETNGVDYNFVSNEEFEKLIASGQMLEYANVFGSYYGTSMKEVERIHGLNKHVLLEIDVQGWDLARQKIPEATPIFILPPSIEELWTRLKARATEEESVQVRRLMTAFHEIQLGHLYSYFIINDEFDKAFHTLKSFIVDGVKPELNHENGSKYCQKLIDEMRSSEWVQQLRDKYKLS